MNSGFLKKIITFQGVYYITTGLWAIFFFRNFFSLTRHVPKGPVPDLQFVIFANAELFIIIGAALLLGLFWKLYKMTIFLSFFTALAVIIAELIYLPQIENSSLFWADFVIESFFVFSAAVYKFKNKRNIF